MDSKTMLLRLGILFVILIVAIGIVNVGCVCSSSTAGTDYECGDNDTAMAGNVSETGEVAGGSTAYFGGGIRLECKKTNHWIVEHNNVHDNYGPGIFVRGDENVIRYNDVTGSENASDVESGCAVGVGYGIYFCGVYNSITANTFCENAGIDIRDDVGSNFGDENTCDCTHDYDDDGTTGCSYDCSPAPDLVIVNKTEEWIIEGSTYNVIYTVKNIGDANANASTTSITIDGAEETTDSVPELAAGASHTSTVGPFSMSGTNDTIKVCADKDNVVSEKSKEYNNCQENVFTVEDITPPGSISDLTNVTGNFWINWMWTNPADEDFNYTKVYINGTFETNTSIEYFNLTNLSPHATKTISTHTVDTPGNVNETWVNQTTTIPNNEPVLEHIGNKTVDEGQTVTIDVNATDLDNDTLTYSCNRTDLFADFNRTTGVGCWTPSSGQAGTYYVDFSVSDGYGGMDNETIEIIVLDKTPPASIFNLSYTNGTTWINWSWTNPPQEDFNYTMVYLNGTWKTNTSTEYYNATGLIPATNYTISTLTVDKVGNINTTWINLTTKTQAEATPTVSISTDKKEYHPGDIMNVTIHLQNPTETAHQLILAWYLILPDSEDRKEIMFTKITLPPGFDESFSMPLRIKYWAAIEFNATWHTALLDGTTYEIISEDKADWRYVPVKMKKHETQTLENFERM